MTHDLTRPGSDGTQPSTETNRHPFPAPFNMMLDAVAIARGLIEQMEPLTPDESEAHLRARGRLDRLQHLLETDRDRGERASAPAMALLLCLESHPDRPQAIHDHLVVPLLAIGDTPTRSLRAWANQWTSNANIAVYRELAALRTSKEANTP